MGFLNINKPLGITSHDVVSAVRRHTGIRKVGHAGTLDPLATGVLVMCVGRATRLSEYVMASTKTYHARVCLGKTTETDDAEGEVLQIRDASGISREAVESLFPEFTGDIQQLPPIYSAIKKNGKKLYELAREGKTVEREPRDVRIDKLTLTDWQPPEFTLEVVCGSGTYIRSLARDIGEALLVGGYLSGLVRTRSGSFSLENAVSLETFKATTDWERWLVPPVNALQDWPAVILDAAAADDVIHGRFIAGADDVMDDTLARGLVDGKLLAILRAQRGRWRPHKVFSTPD